MSAASALLPSRTACCLLLAACSFFFTSLREVSERSMANSCPAFCGSRTTVTGVGSAGLSFTGIVTKVMFFVSILPSSRAREVSLLIDPIP